MGNPSPVQQCDSTAHKTPSRLQPALVGKIKNFGKRFELSKTRAAYFSGEHLGFAPFCPLKPHFPWQRSYFWTPCSGPGLFLKSHCTSTHEAA